MVEIDAGLWRSGLGGGPSRAETWGYCSRAEEGNRCWGGKPSTLGGEEGVGRDTEDAVMMEASPTSAFVVVKTEFSLELLVVALNAPAQLGKTDELFDCGFL